LRRCLRLAALAASFLLAVVSQSGCGGDSNAPPSGLDTRVFIAIESSSISSLVIANATKDQLTSNVVQGVGAAPALMIPGANNTTLVFASASGAVSIVDNQKEALAASITTNCPSGASSCPPTLLAPTDSIVASSDGKFAYAAMPTISQVAVLALTAGPPITVTNIPATPANCAATNNCLPGAHRVVLSHNSGKLLVFNESLDQFEVINTSDSSVRTVTGTGLDRPSFAVFSADDSKAYILNCGAECGGKQASVSVLDTSALTISQTVPVDAATIGASDANNLYVAGTGPNGGSVTVLPLSSLTPGKAIPIGDGFHHVITLFQNKVIIGARTCSKGCMSIVDPSGTAVVDSPKGDVTSITAITPRKVVYATEGGEVRIYDLTNGQELLNNNTQLIDVVGKAASVLYVGPKTTS
jgi:hypothetical protein